MFSVYVFRHWWMFIMHEKLEIFVLHLEICCRSLHAIIERGSKQGVTRKYLLLFVTFCHVLFWRKWRTKLFCVYLMCWYFDKLNIIFNLVLVCSVLVWNDCSDLVRACQSQTRFQQDFDCRSIPSGRPVDLFLVVIVHVLFASFFVMLSSQLKQLCLWHIQLV